MEYLILCVGNRDGGDDAIGPFIADRMKSESSEMIVIDCGVTPESYTLDVKKHRPKTVIIVDAVEMDLSPGQIRIIPEEKIGTMHISTHGIPLPVLIKYLKQYVDNVFLIGIQPETLSGSLTDHVKKSGEKLVSLLKNKDLNKIRTL